MYIIAAFGGLLLPGKFLTTRELKSGGAVGYLIMKWPS